MKAIALVRVSTIQQHFEKQSEELVEMAVKDGYSKNNIITIENKESGIKVKDETDILGLTTMFRLIEEDSSINCVYVWELSRLSRKEEINLKVKNFLIDHKVNLKVKTPSFSLFDENGKLNNATEIVFAMFNVLAQQEMKLKAERFARGKAEAIERGEIGLGTSRFGYYVGKDKKIYIDEEESKVVRFIFKSYLNGMATHDIYLECYEKGWIKKHLNRASESGAIQKILSEKKYIGTYTSSGNIRYPQIISEEDWNKCEELRRKNKTNKKLVKNCFLGRGILFYKGYSLCGRNKRSYIGKTISFSVAISLIDYIIWDVTKDLQLKTEVTNRKEKLNQLRKNKEDVSIKLLACDKHLKEIDERIERVDDIYSIGGKSKEWLKKQYSTIEKDKNEIIERRNKLLICLEDLETEIKNFDVNDYSSILSYGELDYFYNTNEKKKKLIDENIEKIEIKDGIVFKTIEVTSKKYGKLNYFYQYLFNKHRRYTLFKCKYSNNGNKLSRVLKYK